MNQYLPKFPFFAPPPTFSILSVLQPHDTIFAFINLGMVPPLGLKDLLKFLAPFKKS